MARYDYDGLFRRIKKTVTNRGSGPVYSSDASMTGIEAGDRTDHFYYAGWRVVEVRNDSDKTLGQFVYGTQYIDEPVCYDRNTDVTSDNDCLEASGSQRYFYHQDANYRVVALTAEDGTIVERYEYDAYGEPTILGGSTASSTAELGNTRYVSIVGNPLMHQGLWRDPDSASYQNRFRQLLARVGRFAQRDPLRYLDGMSLVQYLASNPIQYSDPRGLQFRPPPWAAPSWGGLKTPPGRVTWRQAWQKVRESRSRGNCYRYACGDPLSNAEIDHGDVFDYHHRHNRNPGHCSQPPGGWTCAVVNEYAKMDGLLDAGPDGSCPPGTIPVVPVVAPGPNGDHHWYRETQPCTWRHKRGGMAEEGVDYGGNPVTDPSNANRGRYTQVCKTMCLPGARVELY